MAEKKLSAEEFLAMAEDADRQAERAISEKERAKWARFAKGYRELARVAKEILAKRSVQP